MQRNDAGEEWPNLVDVVLAWSLEDVMNEDLFKDKVRAIHFTHTGLIHQFAGWASPRLCVVVLIIRLAKIWTDSFFKRFSGLGGYDAGFAGTN
jgi:hypothetical protein